MLTNRGIRIDDETYLKIQEIAKRDNRSASNLIVFVIKKFVAEYESKNGIIEVDVDEKYE